MFDVLMLGAFIFLGWFNYLAGVKGVNRFWILSVGLWLLTADCLIREAWWAFTALTVFNAVCATIGWIRSCRPP